MAQHGNIETEADEASAWGGKVSPFKTSYGKLMIWFFLVSDALTFGGLLVAYGFTRHAYTGNWPIGEEVFRKIPFTEADLPLLYVAIMTFILIISSVTMVLAVEAGHRMDRKGVTKWMFATIIGGFFFLGSQAWEWTHFIHGSELGRIQLEDGSLAYVRGEAGKIQKFEITSAGAHHKIGDVITENLAHQYEHAIADGKVAKDGTIILHDGSLAKVTKEADKIESLLIRKSGSKHHVVGEKIESKDATRYYEEAVTSGKSNRVVFGANLQQNEYGPQHYAQFFFFITGFHGFHVFTGVLLNIIVFFGVIRGVYQKRGHYEMIEKAGLYWHFVDLVWVFVFTFFYLV
jgi:cytochrome c oxidase subunit 3